MAKYCPVTNDKVLYLECLECEEKICKRALPVISTDIASEFIKVSDENCFYKKER